MKARTLDGDWFSFSMNDAPTLISPTELVLFSRPNTPILSVKDIRRGDTQTNLFEGDIIRMDGTDWIICYERGFYAINDSYVIRYFNSFTDYEVIGDNTTIKFPVPIALRAKHLFKYNECVFRLEDIIGAVNNKLILRSQSLPIKPKKVQQECCMCYEGRKIFLGDRIGDSIVELVDGRIVIKSNSDYIDLATGGTLRNGCA